MNALHIHPQPTAQQLSPAQRRFNQLLTRINNLTVQMQSLDMLVQKHHAPHQQAMSALQQQIDERHKTLLLQLHSQLQTLKLGKVQKRDLTSIICHFLQQTEPPQDPELQALFDLYFSEEEQTIWAEEDAEYAEHLRQLFGEDLSEEEKQALPDDPETLWMLLMRKTARENMQRTQETGPDTKPTKPRKTSARQRQMEQEALDAKTTLRSLYRQLASALHPDRETDPEERERKTVLMSQVNAAYKRQDLATLLRLQLQTTTMDEQSIARMTDEKIATMSTLLQEQVRTLESELYMAKQRASMALDTPLGTKISELAIVRQLNAQRRRMQEALDEIQVDIEAVKDPLRLKDWIKTQRTLIQQQAPMMDWMDDWGW